MHLTSIDLNLLPVLRAVLETGSVQDAAKRVSLSPSATSHALSRARELFDDPLLVRAGQRLVPTTRGEELLRKLGTRLDDLESALGSEAAFDPKTLSKSFNIGCNDYGEFTLVQPLGRRFAAMAPRVNLYCVEATGQVFERLRSGTLDVGIGVFSNIPPDINHRVLLRDEFVCAVRTGHPVLKRKWNLERYLELSHVLVSPGGTPEGVVDRILNAQGLSRRVARTVSNFLAAPLLVSESDYVLTVSKRILDALGDRVKLA
ncbi:MAG: LysR family transcriptional regulator, partial [Myxococcota bacterium]